MEIKNKYHYTYFIHPYVIKENKYNKYILKLLKDKKCKIRFFQKEKDLDIYTHFLPSIRRYLFPTFEFSKNKIRRFKEMPRETQAAILSKSPCTIFEYNIGKNVQGKMGKEAGIFFRIEKIEIICFNTGICFLNIKTNIEDSDKFEDVLDFNYKFRDINSEFSTLKDFENIRIQTNSFSDIKKINELINDITGNSNQINNLDIDINSFLVYSYTCIDQDVWNENKEFSEIEHEFFKYINVLPSGYNISFNNSNERKKVKTISNFKYVKYGFSKKGTSLLTSNIDTLNYTKIPHSFENEYLYTYILNIYKRIFLKKINMEYKQSSNMKRTRKRFVKFTQDLWIQESTNANLGGNLNQRWKESLELDQLYLEVKNKYDILYKEQNIEKTTKTNKVIMLVLVISLIINILNFFVLFKAK